MTTGIYLIRFANGAEYVGQSHNIEKRWESHKNDMNSGKSATKLMNAFNDTGRPTFEILDECHRDNLDTLENYYIQMLRPSLNTVTADMFSDMELTAIERNKHLLHKSTPALLDYIDGLSATLNVCLEQARALQENIEEIEHIRTEREASIGAVRELTMLKTNYENEVQELQSELDEIREELEWTNLPWWKKIV